jgi:outer membrane protein
MHRLTAAGVCLICLAFLFGGAAAAEPLKVGVIDFQKVLETSKAGQAAKQEINKAGKEMESELQKRKSEIDENRKNLERESLVMNQQAREEREREIRIQINDFKVLQQKYFAEFKTKEQKLIQEIQDEVFQIVEKMGKEQAYSLILEKRESAAIYFDSRLDITDELIRRFDEAHADSAPKTE